MFLHLFKVALLCICLERPRPSKFTHADSLALLLSFATNACLHQCTVGSAGWSLPVLSCGLRLWVGRRLRFGGGCIERCPLALVQPIHWTLHMDPLKSLANFYRSNPQMMCAGPGAGQHNHIFEFQTTASSLAWTSQNCSLCIHQRIEVIGRCRHRSRNTLPKPYEHGLSARSCQIMPHDSRHHLETTHLANPTVRLKSTFGLGRQAFGALGGNHGLATPRASKHKHLIAFLSTFVQVMGCVAQHPSCR